MVYLGNDCIFWLLYIVHLLKCMSLNTVKIEDENKLTAVLFDTRETYKTNQLVNQVTVLAVKKIFASEPTKSRVKRQSSGGKYTDAAQMPQVKVLRLFLQGLKNLWAPVYVGGAHPFHHEIPKPIVNLFKDKIVAWFFPKVGDEAVKA